MSFLSKLFGSKPEPQPEPERPIDVEADLVRLENEAANAPPGYVGSAYNKAGDKALRAGQADRAVGYYGLAIDSFLADAQREAARGVANKIIRVRPKATRTLCTLTWLDLAAEHRAMAIVHLDQYVGAARAAGQQARAATQIHAMARVSADQTFIKVVADSLESLEFVNRAAEVRRWATDGAPDATTGDDLSDKCFEGAIHSNDRDQELLTDEV